MSCVIVVRSYIYDNTHTFVPVCWFLLFSCSHFLDNAVQIWDVRRPYIPFGSFVEHTDDVTGKGDRRLDEMLMNVLQCETSNLGNFMKLGLDLDMALWSLVSVCSISGELS